MDNFFWFTLQLSMLWVYLKVKLSLHKLFWSQKSNLGKIVFFSAVVVINNIEYGRGVGSSKKEAKSEAARLTLEILIPEFKNNLVAKNGVITKETVDLSVSFDN